MNIIITAGGTSEKIDPVRKITNTSTGLLASKIYNALVEVIHGHHNPIHIDYVAAKNAQLPKIKSPHQLYSVTDTQSVDQILSELFTSKKIDIMIHCMAVSDYYVSRIQTETQLATELLDLVEQKNTASQEVQLDDVLTILRNNSYHQLDKCNKIVSSESLYLRLSETPKLIEKVKKISPNTRLIGFKLLHNAPEEYLLQTANMMALTSRCELVVANNLTSIHGENHEAFIIKNGKVIDTCFTKEEIANSLKDYLFST
ncbi:phosphopantothenoylcysteine decarboxylase domain-containing protein [Petrocella sp. FN5]|uniref:phosphopantothenoylcysteine decarboxylase domain-containing protein n=1 Tax=Petrocella sp. FN5 TaxID=3032002 RepID=UPI0023DC4DD6|nr:phosphopantothenoylcysteine decarboxylase [Petrocella sp. FN5]MDF1618511.1 phosphopantothenoylcysteine decarboxylase [Petrocella sp. FN5]